MAKKTRKIFIFLGIIFAFLMKASFVLALELKYPTILGYSVNETSNVGDYVCYIYGFIVNAAYVVAGIVIAYGGIKYLLAYLGGKFTSDAKEWVKAGISGFLLCFLASLIAITINSSLTSCKFGILTFINFGSLGGQPSYNGIPISTYKEIPIGTLTENLLIKSMDYCFGFDASGNPISPAYANHDRSDCLSQLVVGAENKAKAVSALSKEINNLMSQCSCENANGSDKKIICNQPTKDNCSNDVNYQCTSTCTGPGCSNTTPKDCCPEGVKDKIEHGPVDVTFENSNGNANCNAKPVTYHGLDEFRCPNPISGGHSNCDDIENFVQSGNTINKDNWNKLNLLQQMIRRRPRAGTPGPGQVVRTCALP